MTMYDVPSTKNDPYFDAWWHSQLQGYLEPNDLADKIKAQPKETNEKVAYLFRWCAFQLRPESASSPQKTTPLCTFDDFSKLALTAAKANMFSSENLHIYVQYWSSVIGDCGFYCPEAAQLLIQCGYLTPCYNHVEQVAEEHPDLSVWMLRQMSKEDLLRFYAKSLDEKSSTSPKVIAELLKALPNLAQHYDELLRYNHLEDGQPDPLLNRLDSNHEDVVFTLLEMRENYKGDDKRAYELLKRAIEQNWQKVVPWAIQIAGKSIIDYKFEKKISLEETLTPDLDNITVSCDCIELAALQKKSKIYEMLFEVHFQDYFDGDYIVLIHPFAVVAGSLKCLKTSLFMRYTNDLGSQARQAAILADINQVLEINEIETDDAFGVIGKMSEGETLLSLACKLKKCEIALYLLEQGGDFSLQSYRTLCYAISHQLRPVAMAILKRSTGKIWYHWVNQYLAKDSTMKIQTDQGDDYVFMHIAKMGNIHLLKLALQKGCPLGPFTTEHLQIIFNNICTSINQASVLSFVEFLDFMFLSTNPHDITRTMVKHTVDYTSFLRELSKRFTHKEIQPIVERCIKLGADISKIPLA